MTKLLITGGHLTPAYALVQKALEQNWVVLFVGRRYSFEHEDTLSVEYQTISQLGIPFYNLTTGRLRRFMSWVTVISFFKIPIGFIQSFLILLREKPDCVLSFGGYIALPVSFAAFFLRIPVVTHEQTMQPGLANRLIGLVARKICISWKNTKHVFSPEKTILTGNPIRNSVFSIRKKFELPSSFPILYITGGSLGSVSINQTIAKIIPHLLKTFTVIHQCGSSHERHDFTMLTRLRNSLSPALQKRYLVAEYIDDDHIGWTLKNAALLVSRSGANTIAEIISLGKPAVLIPLPWAGLDEQRIHARFLSESNAATLLDQDRLNEKTLLDAIKKTYEHKDILKKNLARLNKDSILNATDRIMQEITQVISSFS